MVESDGEFEDLCRLYWGEAGPYPHLSRDRLLALTAELAPEGESSMWRHLLDELARRYGGRELRGRLVVQPGDGCVHLLPRRLAATSCRRAAS
jgi:hypothetical protein